MSLVDVMTSAESHITKDICELLRRKVKLNFEILRRRYCGTRAQLSAHISSHVIRNHKFVCRDQFQIAAASCFIYFSPLQLTRPRSEWAIFSSLRAGADAGISDISWDFDLLSHTSSLVDLARGWWRTIWFVWISSQRLIVFTKEIS